MTVHNKGFKANRDRIVLIHSYNTMCRDFKIPKNQRMKPIDIARISNEMLFKVNKDLYSQATVKQARKLAVKMKLVDKPETWFSRIADWFKRLQNA